VPLVSAAAALMMACAAAININPVWDNLYEVPGLCGKWKMGIDNKVPSCKPVATTSGRMMNDDLYDPKVNLGPNVHAVKEFWEFGTAATGSATTLYNTFKLTSQYWTDPPCLTRKRWCTNWNETSRTCAVSDVKQCPPYQNRVGFEKDCGCTSSSAGWDCSAKGGSKGAGYGLPAQGSGPFCIRTAEKACPVEACMDEEFYPGCGSYDEAQTWSDARHGPGTFAKPSQELNLELSGTISNMFAADSPKLSDQTCDILCPCLEMMPNPRKFDPANKTCTWGMAPGKRFTCDQYDFTAWKRCQGCISTGPTWDRSGAGPWKCVDSAGNRDTALETMGYPQNLDAGNGGNPNFMPAFKDRGSDMFDHVYTGMTKVAFKWNNLKALPVRFNVGKIMVTANSAAQVNYMNAQCPCKTWVAKASQDVAKCTVDNCHFLSAKGLFSKSPEAVANCPANTHCLFAQVYRKGGNWLYVGPMTNTFSGMMRTTVTGRDVYNLISVRPACKDSEWATKPHYPDENNGALYEESSASRISGGSAITMAVALLAAHLFAH